MTLLYLLSIEWPAGSQKIGVTTRGPVEVVPIIGPPCQINGGLPLAASSVFWAPQALAMVCARTTPANRSPPGSFAAQPPVACVDVRAAAETAVVSRPPTNAPMASSTNSFPIEQFLPFRLQKDRLS